MPPLADAMDAVRLSVDRFCLLAGVEALAEMMEEDATTVCGARHRRHGNRRGYRWGHTQSEIGYHGGRVKVQRPRVRDHAGKEVGLESWQVLRDGNLLLEWALNLMVLNVPTRKYHRAVRLPEGDLAKARGDGTSKSAVSRRFVALSRKKMEAWLASDLSELDLLVIQIDGLHVGDHVLVAAIGVDGNGDKHVLAVVEGATENTVVVQALLDNLLARGLDPTLPRLFIVDGAKGLWCMEPRWCDRPFPGWLADPDCVWFRRTDRAIECVDLHGDFGLLGLECASVERAAVEPLDASHGCFAKRSQSVALSFLPVHPSLRRDLRRMVLPFRSAMRRVRERNGCGAWRDDDFRW